MNLVLWEHNGDWTAGFQGQSHNLGEVSDPDALIQGIRAAIGSENVQRVLLAVGSERVFFHRFEKPAGRFERQSLVFEFETALPVSAEEFECDFQTQGSDIAGLAAPRQKLEPWLHALEDAGLPVYSVTPTGLLALQYWQQNTRQTNGLVVWQHKNELDVFLVQDGHLQLWRTHSGDPSQIQVLQSELAALRLQANPNTPTYLLDASEQVATVCLEIDPNCRKDSLSLAKSVVASGSSILAGKADPLFELRRGSLVVGSAIRPYESALRVLLGAACLLLAILSFAFFQRSQTYAAQTEELRQTQRDAFLDVLPEEEPPRDILARLEDEVRILAGGKSQSADEATSASALLRLNEFMARLPERSLRLETELLKVTEAGVELNGTVPTSQAANQLVTALRADGHFSVRENIQKNESGQWTVNLVLQTNTEAR